MPRDDLGNVAAMVFEPNARLSRMNTSGLVEAYITSAMRDVTQRMRKMVCDAIGQQVEHFHLNPRPRKLLDNVPPEVISQIWDYYLGFIEAMSPEQRQIYRECPEMLDLDHLGVILKTGVSAWIPPDHQKEDMQIIRDIEAGYKPHLGPVTFKGTSGKLIRTKVNVRIGTMYIMLLEKIGDDWSAVSSARHQQFGVLATLSGADRHSSPYKQQPVRALGEAEVRIMVSYAGPEITAELLDQNNSPETHAEVVNTILNADKPTEIKRVVDRNKIPLGGSRPIQLVKHVLSTGGIRFAYEPQKQ